MTAAALGVLCGSRIGEGFGAELARWVARELRLRGIRPVDLIDEDRRCVRAAIAVVPDRTTMPRLERHRFASRCEGLVVGVVRYGRGGPAPHVVHLIERQVPVVDLEHLVVCPVRWRRTGPDAADAIALHLLVDNLLDLPIRALPVAGRLSSTDPDEPRF